MDISQFYDETGIVDHFHRSLYFLNAARGSPFEEDFSWNILASIYSSRAIFEITYTNFENNIFGHDPGKLASDARAAVRRFKVIESVRVQDFHRGAVKFNPRTNAIIGPMNLKTSSQRGSFVGLSLDPKAGQVIENKIRNSSIKHDRTIKINALSIEDPDQDEMIPIDLAIEEYLRDMKIFLSSMSKSFEKVSLYFLQRRLLDSGDSVSNACPVCRLNERDLQI